MVPTQAVHIVWFYNKDIFEEAGVEVPQTWDELVEACEKIDAAGYIPISSNSTWKTQQWMMEVYWDQYNKDVHEIVRAKPGDWNYDEEKDGEFEFDPEDPKLGSNYTLNNQRLFKALDDGVLGFDTPQYIQFITNFTKVFTKYLNEDTFVNGDDYVPFLTGKAAMRIHGAWAMPTLEKDLENLSPDKREEYKLGEDDVIKPFEWGVFEFPSMTGEYVQAPARNVESAIGEYISIIDKDQEQTDMVLDFVKFWLSEPGYQAWIDGYEENSEDGFIPSGPVMVKRVELPEDVRDLYSDIEMKGNAELAVNLPHYQFIGVSNHQKGKDLIKEVLDGNITPEEYANKMQELMQEVFDQTLEDAGLTYEDLENPERKPAE